ncbi:carbon storage regulator, CsrA [Neorhodopirellula lusitana]|uniref:Translational regulator CsrA n=1 Tax=Neorhodopirellula lusitana TaxID=445327 RepID=A0ABY1PR18_9BACT|nr:carbon storage regulator CsrA [Neorhodopirellula lusitana]SMP43322.1 carbon storage regulator, CsrA [Neorhodopirellula lusitana]
MLVLTRKPEESIFINENVEVVVLGIQGNKVRLGIEAPKDVSILRREIFVELNQHDSANSDLLKTSKPAGNKPAGDTVKFNSLKS